MRGWLPRALLLGVLGVIAIPSAADGRVLPMEIDAQEYNQWCWAGIGQALLRYYGHNPRQCEIAEYVRSKAKWHDFGSTDCCQDALKGCNFYNHMDSRPGGIGDFLQQMGKVGSAMRHRALELDEIKVEIDKDRPVLARVVVKQDYGHFVVIHGIEKDLLHYADPWPGEGAKLGTHQWFLTGSYFEWTHSLVMTSTCRCTATTPCCDGCAMRNDGVVCDDGDLCTEQTVCGDGRCAGGSKVECADAGPCQHVGVCDPKTGSCVFKQKSDGIVCDDEDACTREDLCAEGKCVGKSPLVCEVPGPCFDAACDPASGTCTTIEKLDGSTCDDGDLCTEEDVCSGGQCAGRKKDCSPTHSCELAGTCDATTGECAMPLVADDVLCDDGDACITGGRCQEGQCVGQAVVCDEVRECAGPGVCDAKTGCRYPPKADGTRCNAGSCRDGVCVASSRGCAVSQYADVSGMLGLLALLLLARCRQPSRGGKSSGG